VYIDVAPRAARAHLSRAGSRLSALGSVPNTMPSSYLKSYLKRFGAGVQWREWRVENKRVLCITGTFWRTECAHCSLLRWSSRAGGPRSPRAGCLAWCLKLAPEAGAWEQPRVGFWVGSRARDFPTERVLSRTPLIIRTVLPRTPLIISRTNLLEDPRPWHLRAPKHPAESTCPPRTTSSSSRVCLYEIL
jgi:hypothetical protein